MQSGTICNLRCKYCYVPALEHENRLEPTEFKYPLEQIAKAISKERIGGTAIITYVGGGETFLTDDSIKLLKLFLEEGHIVNAVSNMTYTPAIEKICAFPEELRSRLQFSASFHYQELIRKNLMDTYFDNIKKCDEAGIVYYVNLTLGEDCKDNLDEIKQLVKERTGRDPFILYCLDADKDWKRCDFFTEDFIKKLSEKFNIEHLLIENKVSYEKRRNEFCYMGDWAFMFDLQHGTISPCFDAPVTQNIVQDLTKPIKFEAVGKCCSNFCSMGARFLGLGVIPQIKEFHTYNGLYKDFKNHPSTSKVAEYTDNYLWETNKRYPWIKEEYIKIKRNFDKKYKVGTWMTKKDK